jgi:hypothetical protein
MTGKDHALLRELIHVWRRKLLLPLACILPKDTDVSGAQVIAQNENDIGSGSRLGFSRSVQAEQNGKQARGKSDSYFHHWLTFYFDRPS